MTRDTIDRFKRWGESFIVFCTILGILAIPGNVLARVYIDTAIDSKLIQLDSRIGSLESRFQTLEASNLALIKQNEKMNILLDKLLLKGWGRI